MRLLVDAQLPPALCEWFRDRDHAAEHVRDALGGQTPDREIAVYAEQHGLVLITKDDDVLLRHPIVCAWYGSAAATSPTAACAWLEPH